HKLDHYGIGHDSNKIYNELVVPKESYSFIKQNLFSFKNYMQSVLHAPKWGYYASGRVAINSADGDFITYPSILSPDFGQMYAEHAYGIWQSMKEGMKANEKFKVIEFGAGEAVLAFDFLKFVTTKSQTDPKWKEFFNVLEYQIYEISQGLRLRQKSRLGIYGDKVSVLEGDARNPAGTIKEPVSGLVLTNEVPDAFGVHKVVVNKQGGFEVCFVATRLSPQSINKLKQKGLGAALITRISQNNADIRRQLALKKNNQGDYYLSETDFKEVMDFIAEQPTKDYGDFVRMFDFEEIYLPVDTVADVNAIIQEEGTKIKQSIENEDRRLNRVKRDQTVYVNTDAFKFIKGVGQILSSGYVFTIDYGGSLAELTRGPEGFRTFPVDRRFEEGFPYFQPSMIDLTTDVDFDLLELFGRQAGLNLISYGDQSHLITGTSFGNKNGENYHKKSEIKAVFKEDHLLFKLLVQKKEGTSGHYSVFDHREESKKKTLFDLIGKDNVFKAIEDFSRIHNLSNPDDDLNKIEKLLSEIKFGRGKELRVIDSNWRVVSLAFLKGGFATWVISDPKDAHKKLVEDFMAYLTTQYPNLPDVDIEKYYGDRSLGYSWKRDDEGPGHLNLVYKDSAIERESEVVSYYLSASTDQSSKEKISQSMRGGDILIENGVAVVKSGGNTQVIKDHAMVSGPAVDYLLKNIFKEHGGFFAAHDQNKESVIRAIQQGVITKEDQLTEPLDQLAKESRWNAYLRIIFKAIEYKLISHYGFEQLKKVLLEERFVDSSENFSAKVIKALDLKLITNYEQLKSLLASFEGMMLGKEYAEIILKAIECHVI
ncbi:MAG: SAM-dependent methyltransferase, partial [Candidatus Omnitrophica bacterium]|nr:SAM-dependent methyltransferase [Candidatus Omnitrophota bacterium]